MVVVYLSNRYIRVVEGETSGRNIHTKALYYTVDTSGCILNGTITDEDGFQKIIKNLWDSNGISRKGVHLVVDSSQITTKVVEVPVMKPKQTMEYISREFMDVERISNPIYGYFPFGASAGKKEKLQSVFAAVTPREFIQEYMNIFAGLDIAVSGVESIAGVALRFLQTVSQLEGSTCIVQFADDMALLNLLLVDGEYKYSSRNRMFSESGTPEFAAEAARTVSTLMQFAKAQELSQQIPQVYIAGLSPENFLTYKESIYQIDDQMQADELQMEQNIKIEKSASGQSVSNFALAIGGLLKTDAKTSFMSQMLKDPKKEAEKKKRRKVLIPIAVLTAVMLLITAAVGGRVFYYSFQLGELNEYNQRTDVTAACDEYDALNAKLQSASALGNSMKSLKESVLNYPKVDSTSEQIVASCAAGLVTAEISSYSAEDGVISFNAKASNVDQINRFIGLLSKQEIFADVDYTGYSQSTDGQWSVNVNCVMAGRQEESNDTETN